MEYGNRSFLLLVLCSFVANVYSIKFTLLPNAQKCIRDNLQPHQLNVLELSMTEMHHHEYEYHVSWQNSAAHKNCRYSYLFFFLVSFIVGSWFKGRYFGQKNKCEKSCQGFIHFRSRRHLWSVCHFSCSSRLVCVWLVYLKFS